jgi:hypothetical protein
MFDVVVQKLQTSGSHSGMSVQDRVIAEARAHSSDSLGSSVGMEERCPLHEGRGLGFREQALPRSKTVLGPGDPTQIDTPCGAKCRNLEAIRLAHVPAHVLDFAAKCWNRIQGDARTASTFDLALNIGRLHSGNYSGEARSASSRRVAGLFFRCERRIMLCRTGMCCHVATQKKGTKRAHNAPFSRPRWFFANSA